MPENIFLGIDCSSVVAELALVTADGREFTAREDTPRQADVIFPLLEKLLQDADIKTQDLTAIGAITGPGSFTGIRVGLSLAQGLADGLGVPAYGIDAFAAMKNFPSPLAGEGKGGGDVLVILESKRVELYIQHNRKIEMLAPNEITKLINEKTKIVHNISNPLPLTPSREGRGNDFYDLIGSPVETSMALAAAQHACTKFDQKIPAEVLQPYYVREADAKPSAA